jgi:hypothetical protein
LQGPLRAGTWHLVGDGIMLDAADVQFDVVWRSPAGDQTLATFTHHFAPAPAPAQFDAVPFDGDAPGLAAAARDGDQLVLRITPVSGPMTPSYIPNGDGAAAHGRIPSLTLPP